MDSGQFDRLARLVSRQQSRRGALTTVLSAALAGVVAPFLPGSDGDAKRGRGAHSNRDQHKRKGKRRARHVEDRRVKHGNRRGAAVRAEATCFSGSPCIPGQGAYLAKCDFTDSNTLANVNCTGCNLTNSSFLRSDAHSANFNKANLSRVCLVDADLTGATINASTNLSDVIFCRTRMPNGGINYSGCGKGTSCCPTCDAAHPCPNGQVCCAGKCVSGACCNTNDCEIRTCQNKACSGRQCVYTPISGTTGPNCNTICCNGTCVSTSSLCGGTCGNVCTLQETCCGEKCVPTSALCGGTCDNICKADETCCGEKCTPTTLLCGDNCENICPGGLTCCGEGLCQECCGADASTCKPAGVCETLTCENGVCTYATDNDGTPCEAGKGTCCNGICVPADTLCGGICGNVCAAPTPNCCGQTCRACCTDSQCTDPSESFCVDFQCVAEREPTTFERVRTVVADVLGLDEDQVTMESDFAADLGADSLDAVELIMALEDEFGITITDEDAEEIRTVADAVKYIDEHTV